jgi:hypothetical protein
MYELTVDEHNFLRWLLDKITDDEGNVVDGTYLSDYQKELLASIRNKLLMLSSY